MQGQGLFTGAQLTHVRERWNNTHYLQTESGYNDDVAFHKNKAAQFKKDVVTDGKKDRGRWDWMPDNIVIGDNTGSPNALRSPCGDCTGNLHSAALQAFIENDKQLALGVWKELNWLANFDNLDASNGGSERPSGSPSRPNSKHGTKKRFPYNESFDSHPFFMSFSKLEQYAHSLGLIYDLIKDEDIFKQQKDFVYWWFRDWAEFAYSSAVKRQQTYITQDISKFDNNYKNSSHYSGQGKAQTHSYYNSSGGNAKLRLSTMQSGGYSNRNFDRIAWIAAYGTYFNSAKHRDYAFNMFKSAIQCGMFADGTWNEWYRSHKDSTNTGGDYTWTTLTHFVVMAQGHAVAVHNGFEGVVDAGKYYNYVTSEGSDERCKNYASDSTSGGQKGILAMIKNLGKHYTEFVGQRHSEAGKKYDLKGLPFHLPVAMANTWYNDQEVYDFYNYIDDWGHVNLNPNKSANIRSPHTMGHAWGMGQAVGGLFPYGRLENFVFNTMELEILAREAEEITETSFNWCWGANMGMTGQVEYRRKGFNEDWTESNKENSFLDFHRQRLSGFQEGTTYEIRAKGESADGQSIVDVISEVRTLGEGPEPPEPPTPEPEKAKIVIRVKGNIDVDVKVIRDDD